MRFAIISVPREYFSCLYSMSFLMHVCVLQLLTPFRPHGGHYTAICRPDDGEHWMEFDDRDVNHNPKHVITNACYVLFFRRCNQNGADCTLENLKSKSSPEDISWVRQLSSQRPATADTSAFTLASPQLPQCPKDEQPAYSVLRQSCGAYNSESNYQEFTAQKNNRATILHLGDALNIFLKAKLQSDCLSILKKFQVSNHCSQVSGNGLKSAFDHRSSIDALCAAALSLQFQHVDQESMCHNLAGIIESNSLEFCCTPSFQGYVKAAEFSKSQMPSIIASDYTQKLRSCWKSDSDSFWIGSVELAAFALVYGCEVRVYSFFGGCIPVTFASRLIDDNSKEVGSANRLVSFVRICSLALFNNFCDALSRFI
jgi:hypothetical protein